MNLELFNLLNSKKLEVDSSKKDNIELFNERFEGFFLKYPSRDLMAITNILYGDVVIAFILAHNPFRAHEIIKIIPDIEIFRNFKNWELVKLLFLYFNDPETYNIVCDYENTPFLKLFGLAQRMDIHAKEHGFKTTDVRQLCGFVEKNHNLIATLKPLLTGIDITKIDLIYEFVVSQKGLKKYLKELSEEEREELFKQYGKMLKVKFPAALHLNNYYNFLSAMMAKATKAYSAAEKEVKNHNKRIDELIAKLSIPGEIKEIDDLLRLCPDREAVNLVVDYVIEHNNEYYKSLLEKLETLQRNSDENLENLFKSFGYSYIALSDEERLSIKTMDFDAINSLLKRLSGLGISSISGISFIDNDKLTKVEELCSKGILDSRFVMDNFDILDSNSETLDLVLSNIELLSHQGINIINYSNSLSVLLNSQLKRGLDILKKYDVCITRSTTNINFLNSLDMDRKLDLIITMGLYDNLSSLDILNYTLEELLRLKVADAIGVGMDNIPNSLDYSFGLDKTFIPEDIALILKEGNSSSNASIPQCLFDYQVNLQVLNIKGVWVSINKLLNNLSKFTYITPEIIFYSIIYDSYYSLEEIATIEEALLPSRNLYTLVRG